MKDQDSNRLTGWRAKGHEIIFEADTKAGKLFDVVLIITIILSMAVVLLESVAEIRAKHGTLLRVAEWIFTILFSIEYALRLMCVGRPLKYAHSFFGIVDVLAVVPTYISVLIPGAQALAVIRSLRILRVFRVLKLAHYVRESEELMRAMAGSRRKIAVFLFAVGTLVIIFGSLMFLIEGPNSGFTSIPRGIYWAIVTMTTVGYGDVAPQTPLGQAIAAAIMIVGYGIIAVPTGIVTAEFARGQGPSMSTRACPACSAAGHEPSALFCKRCGASL